MQVFTIAAPGARPLWILLPVAIVLAASAAAVTCDYSLIMSPDDPEGFMAALRAMRSR